MRTGFEIFLLTAEELSISRAAQRAFVTQQCVSDHIKRLESEYGVTLFERKPKMKLTPAGVTMLESLRNINILEKNLSNSLREMAKGERGSFTLGISTSRASVILPGVLSRYYQIFPHVNISFCIEDTKILQERLLRGEIDLFIGVNTDPDPAFQIHTMAEDEIMLIISSQLLHAHFDKEEIKAMGGGVNLNHFRSIPFTLSFKTGKVNELIREYLNYHKLHLNVIYNVSDSETQILLCASGICASLCPRMLLNTAYRHNLTSNDQNKLYMFSIDKLDRPLHVEVVSHKDVIQPLFIRQFIALMEEEVKQISHK